LVNGLPLVLIEAKTPVKKCISWVDGAVQVHDDYEKFVPELFVCNVFSVATEGKAYHYGSIGLPVKDWGPWHLDGDGDDGQHHPLKSLKLSAEHAAPACGAGHPRQLHPVRHQQEKAAHQDHLPLPAV
jgi:type I restriction enzyme R subunit